MYRKFDVTGNLLFAQCFFFEELNTAYKSMCSGPSAQRYWETKESYTEYSMERTVISWGCWQRILFVARSIEK
jgi:hypothetical protein